MVHILQLKKWKKAVESEHWTDYVHGDLVLRVFKLEFEYLAIKDVREILDGDNLKIGYRWILFKK